MDEDEHPSNSMIVGKAKSKGIKRQRDSQEARQTSSSRPRLKRKRSADELEINTQLDSDVDLDGASPEQPSTDSEGLPRSAEKQKGPVGVTVIEDDEEEVQLGMQKVMRAPRYFSQRSFAGSAKKCFNCGQQGHFNRDCPNARQEKPCYLCAKFGHQDFRCPASKVRCYKCNRLGHVSRDCPYPQNSLAIPMVCTQCGHPDCAASGQPDWVRAEGGCTMPYAKSDLDVIRCYVCGKKGHLTCKKATGVPATPSCFNCGLEGHVGSECPDQPTYLASQEKREASNQRGLEELRSNDAYAGEHQEPKRQRRDINSSAYWKAQPSYNSASTPSARQPVQLNRDAEQYRYPTLPPVQHPKPPPQHPAYQVASQPSFAQIGHNYGQRGFSQVSSANFGQSMAMGGFTMGYVPPPRVPPGNFPRNGRRN